MSMFNIGAGAARALATLALVIGAGQALAAPAVLVGNTTGDTLSNPPFTLGWAFTANSNITVTALGLFDSSQDGLAERHAVGLWDSSGNLLATTILGAGAVEPLTNQFRYSTLGSSVALTAGASYHIGALFSTGADQVLFPGTTASFAAAGEINFDGATYGTGGALADPVNSFGGQGFFGPNFLFDATGTVPEPTSLLLVALAIGALGVSRARKPADAAA